MDSILKKTNLKHIKDNEFNLNTFSSKSNGAKGMDKIHSFFRHALLISPDSIKRPKGDTTFFTTAGVQHLETMKREGKDIANCSFSVYQPCIRSQYMPYVQEGTSTSFINFSSVVLGNDSDTFVEYTNSFIRMLQANGVNYKDIRFILDENVESKWYDKKFYSNNISLLVNDIEVGESIFVRDFPYKDGSQTTLIEVGIGIERLNWALGNSIYYFPDFTKVYKENENIEKNKVCSLIDCLRTATLIVGSGVIPSPKDHGYRARKLIKKFNDENNDKLNKNELISIAYDEWEKKGVKHCLQKDIVQLIIDREVERLNRVKQLKNRCNQNYDNKEIKDLVAQILANQGER